MKAFAVVAALGGVNMAREGENGYIEDCRRESLAVARLGEAVSNCVASVQDDAACVQLAIKREHMRS